MKESRSIFAKSLEVRPREWPLLAKMSALLGGMLVLQRFVSLPRLMAMYDADPVENPHLKVEPDRLVYLVTGLVRLTLRDRYCMKRSILIFHFLRRWGYDARILFGVFKEASELKGHAWVVLDEEPLAERGDPRSRYAVTYAYPAEDASA